jgi:hypothetical protein
MKPVIEEGGSGIEPVSNVLSDSIEDSEFIAGYHREEFSYLFQK